ncbi:MULTISPECIES: hypothetical protein [unclassified Neisseria]|uniref:hypothetical protein n=1 Tax=unclassified Neisseria TaxID=2623750 RepID=UPI00142F7E7C|nr:MULTISPECIES: hypothetical protein [unclassified Neisseria]MBF0804505.1 hypothetical protein [Neisseria sp. 19428wB4_WF04]
MENPETLSLGGRLKHRPPAMPAFSDGLLERPSEKNTALTAAASARRQHTQMQQL